MILARVLSIRIELVRSHLSMKGSSAFVCLAWDSKVSAVAMDREFRFDDVSDELGPGLDDRLSTIDHPVSILSKPPDRTQRKL